MSFDAWRWALSWSELSSPEKFVLVMIADHYNDKHLRAWPSIATLARETSLNPRTVTRALRVLEAKGLIETETRHRAGSKQRDSNRYCLPLFDERSTTAVRTDSPVDNSVEPLDSLPIPPRQRVTDTPGTESGDPWHRVQGTLTELQTQRPLEPVRTIEREAS